MRIVRDKQMQSKVRTATWCPSRWFLRKSFCFKVSNYVSDSV